MTERPWQAPEEWVMTSRRRDEVVQAAVTAASAGLAFVRPARLSRVMIGVYRVTMSALAGVSVYSSLREDLLLSTTPSVPISSSIGAAGLVLGVAPAAEWLDSRLERGLTRAGVRYPRAAMAILVVIMGVLAAVLERALAPRASNASAETPSSDVDVPDEVRSLAEALLGQQDICGAVQLRAQLASARGEIWEGSDSSGFWPGVGFRVDPALPRAVPGNANFPVVGRFTAIEGRTFDVYLSVHDGRLASLGITEADDWPADELAEWTHTDRGVHELTAWPSPADITWLVETPNGLSPVQATL